MNWMQENRHSKKLQWLRGLLKKSLEREEQIEKELSEARAQVAVLRGALEEINKVSTEQGLSMLDGACKVDKLACDALETTPSEASERVQKLSELLQDAVSETENAERLSKGFCSAAKAALSEWRRYK